jgi:hypothetical protein
MGQENAVAVNEARDAEVKSELQLKASVQPRRYPLDGLWKAVRRRLHRNSSVSIHIDDGQRRGSVVAHDESELRQIWNSVVLPAAQASRDMWITDTGDLIVT